MLQKELTDDRLRYAFAAPSGQDGDGCQFMRAVPMLLYLSAPYEFTFPVNGKNEASPVQAERIIAHSKDDLANRPSVVSSSRTKSIFWDSVRGNHDR